MKLLLKMENKKSLLMDLLHVICERCPLAENSRRGVTVRRSTPGHNSHSVSLCGFVLLEQAEGTFGSAEQQVVEMVNHDLKDPFLTALSSRLVRQEEVEIRLEVQEVECRNVSHARVLFTLMQKCQIVPKYEDSVQVRVLGSIGAEGWFQLAEAFKLV